MSSTSGTPQGYSVPRHELKETSKRCQHCQSTQHWSFECPDKKSAKKSSASRSGPKLSPSMLLKYGIQKKKILFEPEKTEAEQFNDEMKALESQAREMEKRTQKPSTEGSTLSATSEKPSAPHTAIKRETPFSDDDDDDEDDEQDATAP